MGKQSRRKKGGNNKKKGDGGGTKGLSGAGGGGGGDSTLLQRLRHADPRTRHAALAALSNTLLDPNSLFHSKRKIQINILQAIRERIMDSDLECAQAAAGCLANYIAFGGGGGGQEESMTASWTVVLTERLATCLEKLQQQQQKNPKQWWALTMQCLHALCSLVETNSEALDRLTKSNSVGTLTGLLEVGVRDLLQSKSTVSAEPADMSYQEDVTVYVARTMHSALDDNIELLQQWPKWDFIRACCTNQALPVACRLHCAGCLVTARLVDANEGLQSIVISDVIPVLHSLLVVNMDELSSLANHYTECYKKSKEVEADDALERDVIRKVNERNEPARQIARRQKAMKEKTEKIPPAIMADKETIVEQQEGSDDDTMQDDETTKESSLSPSQRETDDAVESMEKARATWNQALSPIELALEITANLTGLAPPMQDMDDMDMEAEWGLEQEEMLSLQQQQMNGDGALSPLDEALALAIVQSQIPNRLVELLKASCVPLAPDILPDILDGMQELQSKCGACVGNCVGEHFPPWTKGLWQELRCALEASHGNASIANAMAAALRSQADLRTQCQPSDLDFLLTLASSSSPCQKEAVEMLGILCSMEAHPVDVNEKVCLALMAITSKKPAILNEVLNALMDIYGDDECHPNIFRSLNVMAYFQRTTPSFKKYIQCDRDDATEEEVEQWKETALNSSRFLSYKKGKL